MRLILPSVTHILINVLKWKAMKLSIQNEDLKYDSEYHWSLRTIILGSKYILDIPKKGNDKQLSKRKVENLILQWVDHLYKPQPNSHRKETEKKTFG